MDARAMKPPAPAPSAAVAGAGGAGAATLASAGPSSKVVDAAFELSQILDTGLDKETLSILLGLLDTGVSPDALAGVVKELRREAASYRAALAGKQ